MDALVKVDGALTCFNILKCATRTGHTSVSRNAQGTISNGFLPQLLSKITYSFIPQSACQSSSSESSSSLVTSDDRRGRLIPFCRNRAVNSFGYNRTVWGLKAVNLGRDAAAGADPRKLQDEYERLTRVCAVWRYGHIHSV